MGRTKESNEAARDEFEHELKIEARRIKESNDAEREIIKL